MAKELSCHDGRSLFYLAAAVSDFYVPEPKEHKIQSSDHQELHLSLKPVPKLLGQIKQWSPNTKLVSFKLETDSHILEAKALSNLKKYDCDLVIANLLKSYKQECYLYSNDSKLHLQLT